jgi:hypothetical protein
MRALRGLQKRVSRLERAMMPPPSWIDLTYGSFDAFAEAVFQDIVAGKLSEEFADIVVHWREHGVWGLGGTY